MPNWATQGHDLAGWVFVFFQGWGWEWGKKGTSPIALPWNPVAPREAAQLAGEELAPRTHRLTWAFRLQVWDWGHYWDVCWRASGRSRSTTQASVHPCIQLSVGYLLPGTVLEAKDLAGDKPDIVIVPMKLTFGRKPTPELCPQDPLPIIPSINAVSHRQEQRLGLHNFWCSESYVMAEGPQAWRQTGFESWTCHWLEMITALPCDLDSHLWSKDHNICIVKLSRGPETLSSGGRTSALKPPQ